MTANDNNDDDDDEDDDNYNNDFGSTCPATLMNKLRIK